MPDPEQKKFQRRVVFIKKPLQIKYIALVMASVIFALLVVGADVYYTVTKILVEEVDPSLHPVFARFSQMLLVKAVIFFFIVFLASLFVSHRIAGPIYRFEKSTDIVGTGDLTHRVSLRRGDELGELEEHFNEMVANLQRFVQKDKNLSQHIVSKLEAITKDSLSPRVAEQLAALKNELEHLSSGFKV